MKISLVDSEKTWHSKELERAARTAEVRLETVHLFGDNFENEVKKMGDIVIWRSSSIKDYPAKLAFINQLKEKIVINSVLFKHPFAGSKFFQQKLVPSRSNINTIPTWKFRNRKDLLDSIKGGILLFPIICKPDIGAKGENIFLFKNLTDINSFAGSFEGRIFQPFISNNGDYRVLVLGGRALGTIKRVAIKGNFLNNLSQGGRAFQVANKKEQRILFDIATKIATIFELNFCGVDIIYNNEKKAYYFMEVNTIPQWKGFQKTIGINIAKKIICYCKDLYSRKKLPTKILVKKYFFDNFPELYHDQFHFASRMYLWENNDEAKKFLINLREEYIGKSYFETKNILKECLAEEKGIPPFIHKLDERKKYFKKYPKLRAYTKVLSKALFAKNIYAYDIKNLILEIVTEEDLVALKIKIEKDSAAIASLSTFAVNYFYLLESLLGRKNPLARINPELFLKIIKDFPFSKSTDLQIYIITHAIIGESRFYKKKITKNKKLYRQMLKIAEELITKNYQYLSLDIKLEFLVCSELCSRKTSLRDIIIGEAENSLSNLGNFIVDKNSPLYNFTNREHSNVLYLMATSQFQKK